MNNIINHLSFTILFFGCLTILQNRPVRVFHGLGSSCEGHQYNDPLYKCVETGAGNASLNLSIEKQALEGCRLLKEELDTLSPSFYVLGYSQGGLIARWIQLHCKEVKWMIKRMVLVGTPNLGLNKLPTSESFKPKVYTKQEISNMITKNKTWLESLDDKEMKEKITTLYDKTKPIEKETVNYFFDFGISVVNLLNPVITFLDYSPLNYLNSNTKYAPLIENLATETEDENIESLDFIVVIANRDERVVTPPENVTFGVKMFDADGNTISSPKSSQFLIDHPMLYSFWLRTKIINCVSDTSHAQMLGHEFEVIKSTLFSEDYSSISYGTSAYTMKNRFLKLYPNFCCFNKREGLFDRFPKKKTFNDKHATPNIQFILEKSII